MLGVSGMLGDSGDGAAAAAAAEARESATTNGGDVSGGAGPSSAGGLSEEDQKARIHQELGERNSGGYRWPRQETLALLKIRSDMDVAFRDSSLKGPLWEEVSRKLAELGYHRSAKKCKEKFENVYKYHKRTKEGRSTKQDGKTYRFFDQLEALENHPSHPFLITSPRPQSHHIITPASPVAVAIPGCTNPPFVTVPSTPNPTNASQNKATPATITPTNPPPAAAAISNPINIFSFGTSVPTCHPNMSANKWSILTSSSTSSDEEPGRRTKRKRKWAELFQTLMNEVIAKQEEMQKKFFETLEKRERDRVAREEAWRVQEMARMNREHDLLVQERSIAAAKDAAVIAFLEKVSEQQIPNVPQMQIQVQSQDHNNSVPPPPQPLVLQPTPPQPQPQPPPPPQQPVNPPLRSPDYPRIDNGGENFGPITGSSRWPKAEVQALIRLRTNMDTKYQENGPKGPMWEEISSAMSKLGYNRNSKRCKEKWENINKYFKKVKDSNKKRPDDSKTCPYFHLLEALYKEKANNKNDNSFNIKPENQMVPIMVQPEQQWPLPQSATDHQDRDCSENNDQLNNDEEDEEDEEDDAGAYEIVANKPSSVGGTVE